MAMLHIGAERCEYSLTNGEIDAVAAKTESCLKRMKYEPKNITSVRLSIEEYLLRCRQKFGEEGKLVFTIGKRFGRIYLLLEIRGERFNPLETDDEETDWSNRILSKLGLRPVYSYSRGTNQVRLELNPHKNNTFFGILAALVLALLIGGLGRMLLPVETVNAIAENYLSLFSGKFFGLLRMIAAPIIFLSVVGGIGGIEDASSLGKFGKNVLLSFLFSNLLLAAACAVVLPQIFSVSFEGNAAGGDRLGQLLKLLLDILPENIIDPFLSGNSMQIIVLAAACGIAIMLLGKQTAELFCIIDEVNLVVKKVMKWIGSLMPILIFTVVLENIWSDKGKVLATAWQPMLLHIAVSVICVLLYVVYAAAKLHINPILLMRKIAPSAMVGFTTASSSAAYGELNSCCLTEMGVNEKAVRFSVPFGMLLSMVGCVSNLFVTAMYSISVYDVKISLMTLIVSVFIVTMLAVTTPPVPGGLLASYAILFAHFSIPNDALAIAMTLSVFMDFVDTAANVSLISPIIAVSANKLGMLDRSVLLGENGQ